MSWLTIEKDTRIELLTIFNVFAAILSPILVRLMSMLQEEINGIVLLFIFLILAVSFMMGLLTTIVTFLFMLIRALKSIKSIMYKIVIFINGIILALYIIGIASVILDKTLFPYTLLDEIYKSEVYYDEQD